MRGKILDTNGLEAFVELEDEQIISVPTYKIGNSTIGDYVSISDISTDSYSSFKTAQYINPIIKFF